MDSKDINYTPENIEEIISKQFVRFIDTTPNGNTRTWVVVGVGIEDGNANIDYNNDLDRVKWIIDKNARTKVNGSDKQMGVTQSSYKGDPCFEYVNTARDTNGIKTHILEVDTWDETATSGTYKAKMSDATILVETYSGNEVTWNLYFDGDPTDGTCTIANGVPTFTASISL